MGMDCQSIFSDIYPRKRRADMLLRLNVSVFRNDHPYAVKGVKYDTHLFVTTVPQQDNTGFNNIWGLRMVIVIVRLP